MSQFLDCYSDSPRGGHSAEGARHGAPLWARLNPGAFYVDTSERLSSADSSIKSCRDHSSARILPAAATKTNGYKTPHDFSTTCTVCGFHYLRSATESVGTFVSSDGPAHGEGRIAYLPSRGAKDIDDLRHLLITTLAHHGISRDVGDLYSVSEQHILDLHG